MLFAFGIAHRLDHELMIALFGVLHAPFGEVRTPHQHGREISAIHLGMQAVVDVEAPLRVLFHKVVQFLIRNASDQVVFSPRSDDMNFFLMFQQLLCVRCGDER